MLVDLMAMFFSPDFDDSWMTSSFALLRMLGLGPMGGGSAVTLAALLIVDLPATTFVCGSSGTISIRLLWSSLISRGIGFGAGCVMFFGSGRTLGGISGGGSDGATLFFESSFFGASRPGRVRE